MAIKKMAKVDSIIQASYMGTQTKHPTLFFFIKYFFCIWAVSVQSVQNSPSQIIRCGSVLYNVITDVC